MDLAHTAVELLGCAGHVLIKRFSVYGELDVAPLLLEQRRSQLRLQIIDRLRKC